MNLRRLAVGFMGGILAVAALGYTVQHLGLNFETAIGLIVMIIGILILLGLPLSL